MAKDKKPSKPTKAQMEKQQDFEMSVGHKGAQADAPKALKKFRERMVDDEYEQRRNGAKPKAGPGFKKGGRVATKKKK